MIFSPRLQIQFTALLMTVHWCLPSSRPIRSVTTINADPNIILEWGECNLIELNAAKTQAAVFTKKAASAASSLIMSGLTLPLSSSVRLLDVEVGSYMSCHDHVTGIAKAASQKLGELFKTKRLYTSQQLLMLYKAQICPSLEYCSHIWSSARKQTLKLLDSIQKGSYVL